MVLKDQLFFRSDLLAHKVYRATEELVWKISMHFIKPHHLRNTIVETYVQKKDFFRVFNSVHGLV